MGFFERLHRIFIRSKYMPRSLPLNYYYYYYYDLLYWIGRRNNSFVLKTGFENIKLKETLKHTRLISIKIPTFAMVNLRVHSK